MNSDVDELIKIFSEYDLISNFDNDFIYSSLKSRVKNLELKDTKEYFSYLKNNTNEVNLFIQSLYVHYTDFFRNSLSFAILEKIILPELFQKKKLSKDNEIRIWSVATASGQEAYSISMLCFEIKNLLNSEIKFSIFATDLIESQIKKSQIGVYNKSNIKNLTINRLNEHFTVKNECYSINPSLKENIKFSIFDLTDVNCIVPDNCVFGSYDIIFCSNVLIYYNQKIRNQIINKLINSLSNNGYFICDDSETLLINNPGLKLAFPKSSIFQKINNFNLNS